MVQQPSLQRTSCCSSSSCCDDDDDDDDDLFADLFLLQSELATAV